jgi:NADH:ubiquinone oxidoreductase subunit K
VIAGYPGQLWATVEGNLTYPLDHGAAGLVLYLIVAAALIAIGLVAMHRPRGDAYWLMAHGAILGSVILLLVAANPQGYRLELVFVPVIACGFAIALNRLVAVSPR